MQTTTIVAIRVTPRSRTDEIVGWRDGVLLIRVKAPPVDGKANASMLRLVAAAAGIGRNDVEVVAGSGSRDKRVRLPARAAQTLRRLSGAADYHRTQSRAKGQQARQ